MMRRRWRGGARVVTLLGLVGAGAAAQPTVAAVRPAPTVAALRARPVPAWFEDAKFGIFVHWDVASYPAWAEPSGPLNEIIADSTRGWRWWFRHNPYGDWYYNTLRVPGAPLRAHHDSVWGAGTSFFDFGPRFDRATRQLDPDRWAALFARSGARYVVLTTKHHDGFTLWPSAVTNPNRAGWHTSHDIVGKVGRAVRARGMRYGLYYSGGLDWTFNDTVIADLPDLFRAIPRTPAYTRYALAQVRELVQRYHPDVLWNDIGFPATPAELRALWGDYYAAVPTGVINDRFDMLAQEHADFTTPEYAVKDTITAKKWESTRGIGYSFGYTRNEDDRHFLTADAIVRSLVDIVSKNGNLLLNVGPMADGTIPPAQAARIEAVGRWLRTNGEGIYGTRPWVVSSGRTAAGTPLRFTRTDRALYAFLLVPANADTLPNAEVALENLDVAPGATITLLGSTAPLRWTQRGRSLRVRLPTRRPSQPVATLRITPAPRAATGS